MGTMLGPAGSLLVLVFIVLVRCKQIYSISRLFYLPCITKNNNSV